MDLRSTVNGIQATVNTIHTNVMNLESDVNEIQANVNEIQANLQTDRKPDFDVEQNAPIDSGDFMFMIPSAIRPS